MNEDVVDGEVGEIIRYQDLGNGRRNNRGEVMPTDHDAARLLQVAARGLPATKLAVLMTTHTGNRGVDYRASRGDVLSKTYLCAEYAKHIGRYPVTFIDTVRAEAKKTRDAANAKKAHLTAALAECESAKGVEGPVIQIGKTYELTKTVVNPFYDRRVKGDWRHDSAQWDAHTQFRAADDLVIGNPCLTMAGTMRFVSTNSAYGQLIVPHLVIVDTFESFMYELRGRYGSNARPYEILAHLVASGHVTREQIEESVKAMKG